MNFTDNETRTDIHLIEGPYGVEIPTMYMDDDGLWWAEVVCREVKITRHIPKHIVKQDDDQKTEYLRRLARDMQRELHRALKERELEKNVE